MIAKESGTGKKLVFRLPENEAVVVVPLSVKMTLIPGGGGVT